MFCMTGIITLIKKIIFTFGRSDSDTKSSTGDPSFRLQAERCFNMTFAGYVILPFQKKITYISKEIQQATGLEVSDLARTAHQ